MPEEDGYPMAEAILQCTDYRLISKLVHIVYSLTGLVTGVKVEGSFSFIPLVTNFVCYSEVKLEEPPYQPLAVEDLGGVRGCKPPFGA